MEGMVALKTFGGSDAVRNWIELHIWSAMDRE
jgi:hypothetical protein